MDLLAIWLGKLTLLALRVVGRRGTALPGLVVEKVFPGFLPRRLSKLPHGVVVVSGTNGKTTTTKMVAGVLSRQYRVLTNDTGGNFVRGVLTALIAQSGWWRRTPFEVGVFELDEAHAVKFCQVFAPQRVLLLNVLRDQLDRFGELDTTAHILGKVVAAARTSVVLNRDDPRLVALAGKAHSGVRVSYFGVSAELRGAFPTDEEMYSDYRAVSDVPASVQLTDLQLGLTTTIRLTFAVDAEQIEQVEQIELRAEGTHNAQNAAAAAALCVTFGLDHTVIADALGAVEPAFGRGQSLIVQGRRVVLQLVKNPAGFRQCLGTLADLRPGAVVIAINDDYADGRDMSWLWDVPFARQFADRSSWLATSGTRAADMAVRLHYDEIGIELIEPELGAAVDRAVQEVEPGQVVVVFATYTAMWELHQLLEKRAQHDSELSA